MRNLLLSACLLAGPAALAATMASQPWVTNRIAEAVAAIPQPGNYATVSNRAMSALQSHQSLQPSTNYTDRALAAFATTGTVDRAHTAYSASTADSAMSATWAGRLSLGGSVGTDNFTYEGIVNGFTAGTNYTDAALGSFAATGAVARAATYGTPTRWTDATGCVWEVVTGWRVYTNGVVAAGWTAWNYNQDSSEEGTYWVLMIGLDIDAGGITYGIAEQTSPSGTEPHWANELTNVYDSDSDYNGLTVGDTIRAVRGMTNLVGRVALTSDIPDMSGYATPADVTAAIREQSLGGIWDNDLEVWWTPIMQNGALKYVATTNVNLGVNQ